MARRINKQPTHVVAEAILEAANWMDLNGNKGDYVRHMPNDFQWVFGTQYNNARQGIFFYSTGWGWRLRKNPDWRTVFKERFGVDLTAEPEPTPVVRNDETETEKR